MDFYQNFEKIKSICEKKDASSFCGKRIVYEFVLTGEGGGTFYAEIDNGNVNMQPYDYHDNTCSMTISVSDFYALLENRLDPVMAYTLGKLKIRGDIGAALLLKNLFAGR